MAVHFRSHVWRLTLELKDAASLADRCLGAEHWL